MTSPEPPVPEVTTVPPGAFLLDVREPGEWVAGRCPEAVHVPLGALSSRISDVPRGQQVVVICRSGARSARATAFLLSQGFDAVNFAGGMRAWAHAGLPMVSAGGAPPRVI